MKAAYRVSCNVSCRKAGEADECPEGIACDVCTAAGIADMGPSELRKALELVITEYKACERILPTLDQMRMMVIPTIALAVAIVKAERALAGDER